MSNLAKDWQEGSYTVRVTGNLVEASKVHKDTVDGHICYKKSSAQAKCDPEDEFSLSMGVALAMDRLNKELGKDKIEVGDKVKIVKNSFVYSTYADWVAENVSDPCMVARFAYGQLPDNDDTMYVVKAIAPHGGRFREIKLVYVQRYYEFFSGVLDTNRPCYLIDIDGLKKV